MGKNAAVFGLVFLVCGGAQAAPGLSPYIASTAGQFAQSCKADRSSCDAMVGEVLMNKIELQPASHLCLPNMEYATGVPTWLDAHPEAASMPTAEGIYLALTSLYRCGTPGN